MERTWTTEQNAIFAWFENPADRHAVVTARAGTGKTTTIIEGVKRIPSNQRVLICAFSKIIQEELQSRIGTGFPNVEAKTLHAIGYACVRRFRDRIKVEFGNGRADMLAEKVCGKTAPDAIKKLVSKLHTKGREIAPHATKLGDLTAIAITFECEPDEAWASTNFNLEYVEMRALEAMELASNVQAGDTIDGSDMIFLPVRNGWLTKLYDRVIVDEGQDMTTAQLEIAQGVLNTNGLMCIVGDNRQAIFAFRGADSESLGRLQRELDAVEFGLKTTYRCGRAIVEVAQGYVPDFEAAASNPEGAISYTDYAKLTGAAGPGDFILSRVNAPLVSTAMQLLRAGKRTRVAGKDIGKGLVTLVRKLKARSVPDFLAKVEGWAGREIARHEKQAEAATNGRKAAIKSKIEGVRDQADMLCSLADGAKNIDEITSRIEGLFTDDGLGAAGMITCSSVHRSKGLEANRVFILKDTLRETTIEEQNICYVAITRAKSELIWVVDEQEAGSR